jgi:phosphoglycerol transferase MdoB-like AlkP superfamily enzyme
VFATESLSLDFLSPYNPSLPPELTPFYGSTAVTQAMFVNYKTVAAPTHPGLMVTYNSHPNVRALLIGKSELSLVKLLDQQGYETYVLMPGSETFLDNRHFFTALGFQHIIGLETLEKDPKIIPFVEGRGLMDRALYDIALKLLAQNRDKKIYIHVVNTDTHGPVPRDYFGTLQYPPVPASVAAAPPDLPGHWDDDARAILAGIFRHDYDIGLTMRRMEEQNLLTDDTLVVLTADHSFPRSLALNYVPGYPGTILSRIPLAFFSGQHLPDVDRNEFCSQLDFAPSIAHLLGLQIPQGWWGESVFDTNRIAPYGMRFNDKLSVTTDDCAAVRSISISHPATQSETNLLKIFQSLYLDPAETTHLP